MTAISISCRRSDCSLPKGGYTAVLFSTVVGWSHFAQESRLRPPSPGFSFTRMENAMCSTLEIGSTQMSREWALRASLESTKAGRNLSRFKRQTSPRRGYQPAWRSAARGSFPSPGAQAGSAKGASLPRIFLYAAEEPCCLTVQVRLPLHFQSIFEELVHSLTGGNISLSAFDFRKQIRVQGE